MKRAMIAVKGISTPRIRSTRVTGSMQFGVGHDAISCGVRDPKVMCKIAEYINRGSCSEGQATSELGKRSLGDGPLAL